MLWVRDQVAQLTNGVPAVHIVAREIATLLEPQSFVECSRRPRCAKIAAVARHPRPNPAQTSTRGPRAGPLRAVGRFVRWESGVRNQRAWLYVPDDPRVRAWAALITKQRRHSLTRDMSRQSNVSNGHATSLADDDLYQLSLFAPLSAVATDTRSVSPSAWSDVDSIIEVQLAPSSVVATPIVSADGRTRRQTKDALRAANTAAARDLARRTGLSHAQVNAELIVRWGYDGSPRPPSRSSKRG